MKMRKYWLTKNLSNINRKKSMQCLIVEHFHNSRPGKNLSILLKIAANDELASDCS